MAWFDKVNSPLLRFARRLLRLIIKPLTISLSVAAALILIILSINESQILDKGYQAVNDSIYLVRFQYNNLFDKIRYAQESFKTYNDLKRENIYLKQKLTEAEDQLNHYQGFAAENAKLKSLLKYIQNQDKEFVSARILSSSNGPFMRSAIVNVGSKEGVRKEAPVLCDKGLVGRVVNVTETSSLILLLNDYNSRIPSITANTRERTIAKGTNNELLQLEFLPENTQVYPGEILYTSGDGDYYPPGIPVARIIKVKNNDILAKPFYNLKDLEFVSIIVRK